MNSTANQNQQFQSFRPFPLPWDRFWARCIDLLLQLLISFLIYFLLGIGSYLQELTTQTGNIKYFQFINVIITWVIVSVVFLLYESLFLIVIGASPGKALFRIKVKGNDENKLSLNSALRRAISLYCFGHYLFLFNLNIFVIGYFFSGRYFKKTGTFRWDKVSNSVVIQNSLSSRRRNLLIMLGIICITIRVLSPLSMAYNNLSQLLK
jgi:uncharacterized RDD family membrane protein YckC